MNPDTTTIGWVGTGVMGASMAGHLLDAGYRVSVYNRTKSRTDALVERGAEWRDSPGAVAAGADVTFAIVGFPEDVRSVFLGDDGVVANAAEGSVVVDMTTSEPSLAQEIHAKASERGVAAIDAPVSGGDVGARSATLSIMVGADADAFARVRPLFDIMGSTIVHQGGAGAGQHTKMVNQILIATGMIGVCEALLYADDAGLDLPTVLESVSGGAAGSWSLTNYGPRILAGDFDPGFYVDHFVKDMRIALSEAGSAELALPGLALAHQLYVALQAQGGGKNGTQALIRALATMSSREWSASPD